MLVFPCLGGTYWGLLEIFGERTCGRSMRSSNMSHVPYELGQAFQSHSMQFCRLPRLLKVWHALAEFHEKSEESSIQLPK